MLGAPVERVVEAKRRKKKISDTAIDIASKLRGASLLIILLRI